MTKNKKTSKRFLIAFTAVLITVVAILVSRTYIEKEVRSQLYANLRDVAVQNQATIENLLKENQTILKKIIQEIERKEMPMETEEDIRAIVEWMKNYNNIYDFKRMGLIMPDGTCYTTDGYTQKLSDDPYQYGMKGMANISLTINDLIGKTEEINVFSVPMFEEDGKTVKAIAYATIRNAHFKKLINIDSFGGEGYSYIVNYKGDVIADTTKSPMYGSDNVFDSIMHFSKDNKDVVDYLKAEMKAGNSGYETFYTINNRALYYVPLNVKDTNQTWYLWTILPESVLNAKASDVFMIQNVFFLIVIVVLLGLVWYFVLTYRNDAKQLHDVAYTDPLTQGNNISDFKEKIKKLEAARGFIVAIDINDFKLINSICGMEKGDAVIVETWKILASEMTDADIVARESADHFFAYLRVNTKNDVLARIKTISKRIEALKEELNTINILPYFGIYEVKEILDPEEYITCVNQAKNLVKGSQAKNIAFYEEIDLERIVEDKELLDSFHEAIEKEEFEIWYQPKYRASDSAMVGAEALVRWRKADGSLVPPFRFVPLFEGNGMIITLDAYVFEHVCMQQKLWEKEGKKIYPVSINLSRASLYYGDIVGKYQQIIAKQGVSPGIVPLEITESATVNNALIREVVEKFRAAGFAMHLDDFGSGYSSLATLNLIRFDVLKLDKSLVDFIGDTDGEKLVTYTVKMAKDLGMSITAEGVETKHQIDFLDNLGCDDIQGYYFSKPLPVAEFEVLLS